jgi:hypothetical protein
MNSRRRNPSGLESEKTFEIGWASEILEQAT